MQWQCGCIVFLLLHKDSLVALLLLCVCVLYECMCLYMCTQGTCRLEVNTNHSSSIAFHLMFWNQVPHWIWTSPVWLGWPSGNPWDPPFFTPSALGLQVCVAAHGSWWGYWTQDLWLEWRALQWLSYVPCPSTPFLYLLRCQHILDKWIRKHFISMASISTHITNLLLKENTCGYFWTLWKLDGSLFCSSYFRHMHYSSSRPS